MARSCNFDREEKLVLAMELFWQQGYEATSIADLVAYLGINRFSLYNTYGDKLSLYRESLRYYLEQYSQPKLKPLAANGGLDGLLSYIERFVVIQKEQKYGCFLQNAILEKIISDEVVKQQCERLFEGMLAAFNSSIEYAKASGELRADVDPIQVSRFLLMQMQGIRILGKAGQFEVIEGAYQVLKSTLISLKEQE
ncbi:TetR family transcriptional regulator [Shewanella hanedai]|uniref:TetR/AcrR family transcriptional regulator n=1 Tax=Shewanella hanedai TaxID=25 RepID=A0A553JLN0_SHEHA|nr:TetR/AcrR family transcriptional regulator [Shewanella hanedai]TRY13310.1 TetR/AcrR family transcriptional regulator [Shewanella hanedai]GGJ00835.1 TetR family transcriptional regulator [Shewanella hanedai]